MEFRFGRDAEYPALRRLWGQCFGEEEPWTSWYFSHHYKAVHTWVGVQDGNIAAQAHLLPHRLFLRGSWRDTVYFVGVCVDESLRGSGYGRDIMTTALTELRRQGIGISILQPRWPDFYRLLGWDYCYSRRFYHLPLAVAEVLLTEAVSPGLRWLESVDDYSVLPLLYDEFVQSRHGYVDRRPEDWQRLLSDHCGDGGRVGLLMAETQLAGYVLYKLEVDLLRVREMVWRKQTDMTTVLRQLLDMASSAGATRLEWEDPAEDPTTAMFAASHSEPFLMGRMTDCQLVLTGMSYPQRLKASLSVELTDPIASWNSGRFRWQIEHGRCSFVVEPPVGKPDLAISVALLSQLYFGQRPAAELWEAAGEPWPDQWVQGLLAAIFPSCRNFISEYF